MQFRTFFILAFVAILSAQLTIGSSVSGRLNSLSSNGRMHTESVSSDASSQSYQYALSESMVTAINMNLNSTWHAGMNEYFEGKSYQFLKQSCGTKFDRMKLRAAGSATQKVEYDPYIWSLYPTEAQPSALPTEFDARQQWGATCASLSDIRDQAGCGSCWAVAAAEAITDRHCIASNGANSPYISAHNILTCCGVTECGSCEGGYPINAWQFWMNTGVVTGGSFGSSGTCQPYTWPPCEHHTEGLRPKCVAITDTPACSNVCSGGFGGATFDSDKNFGASAYKVDFNEEAIMREIMTNGPVEAGFMVYEDFPHYRSGVYSHTTGAMVGGHAVKILGWGVESGQKYWLVANSWNTNWGDQGYFKIAKGQNECMIEDMIWAGNPRA